MPPDTHSEPISPAESEQKVPIRTNQVQATPKFQSKMPDPEKPEHKKPLSKRSGLTVSKQWVLPPRPKPGRKPKPRPETKTEVKQETPRETRPKDEAHAHAHDHDKDDDTCALCSREDCMCAEIGIKNSPSRRSSLPSLEMILNSSDIKMDAVPLKRPAPAGDTASKAKFARVRDLQPVQPPPVLSIPSPLEGLQNPSDGCGFCTENTPCACAESIPAQPSQPWPVYQYPPPAQFSHIQSPLPFPSMITPPKSQEGSEDDYGCVLCQKDAMSMLFCVSLKSARPLAAESVSIPCHLAIRTLQKHPKFATCDLGRLIRRLEARGRQVGVQSINRVLQELETE